MLTKYVTLCRSVVSDEDITAYSSCVRGHAVLTLCCAQSSVWQPCLRHSLYVLLTKSLCVIGMEYIRAVMPATYSSSNVLFTDL